MSLLLTISLTSCSAHVAGEISFSLIFCVLVITCCMTLRIRHFWVSRLLYASLHFSLGKAFLLTLAWRRERRLPLSIWVFFW
ncbi:hypothetical protein PHAVU_009G141100 [Phaseolus vulgaris]|uniref:Uncharacterized protein n=1 Tax=Phaseolus vulgaris TaxID=3885 RepID=V7AZE2_PHAVU|nr:hypothetical protein PHAVU_009G141100g [Phaseolus vulgaris]ESW09606.1 hypothetical protein PHAVU_009G141100g [Phaseolus vulgaris]